MREFINLAEGLQEKYTRDNVALQNYMTKGEFDPYASWYWVCQWLEENGKLKKIAKALGEPINSADDLEEMEPDLFYKLSPKLQKRCAEEVIERLLSDNPAEAPSHAHMMVTAKKLLPRSTWLVHFSDEAQAIAQSGFVYGVDQMDKLGLTRWLSDFDKSGEGYNFAFQAGSRDSTFAASKGKYGRDCVMFQNSGVSLYHHGDEEDHVAFYGPDVDPRTIVLLRKREGEWFVMNRAAKSGERNYLMRGDFEACEKLVMTHAGNYRGTATGR